MTNVRNTGNIELVSLDLLMSCFPRALFSAAGSWVVCQKLCHNSFLSLVVGILVLLRCWQKSRILCFRQQQGTCYEVLFRKRRVIRSVGDVPCECCSTVLLEHRSQLSILNLLSLFTIRRVFKDQHKVTMEAMRHMVKVHNESMFVKKKSAWNACYALNNLACSEHQRAMQRYASLNSLRFALLLCVIALR